MIKSVAELPVSVLMLAMVSTCAGFTVSICADWLPVAPTLPARSTTRTCGGGAVGERASVNVTPVKAVCGDGHVHPCCAVVGTDLREFVSAERRPNTPRTVSEVSLVIKSLLLAPVSSLIPVMVILFAASGLVVSTTTFCVAVCPTFPARSTTRTV